jgi:hypothetical protein
MLTQSIHQEKETNNGGCIKCLNSFVTKEHLISWISWNRMEELSNKRCKTNVNIKNQIKQFKQCRFGRTTYTVVENYDGFC